MAFHVGDHVLADFGDGYVVAHIAGAADDDGKHLVQKPDGNTVRLANREEADIDDAGSGGTFKSV